MAHKFLVEGILMVINGENIILMKPRKKIVIEEAMLLWKKIFLIKVCTKHTKYSRNFYVKTFI